jgi:hypothetical protein
MTFPAFTNISIVPWTTMESSRLPTYQTRHKARLVSNLNHFSVVITSFILLHITNNDTSGTGLFLDKLKVYKGIKEKRREGVQQSERSGDC